MHQVDMQYADAEQQADTNRMGMWVFLASEILLFGGLITGYTVYRVVRNEGFGEASHHLYQSIGAINTAVLLFSSLTMALAVHATKGGLRKPAAALLAATAALGAAFLAIKGVEYWLDYSESVIPVLKFDPTKFEHPDGASLFFVFYYVMTGLHALHLLIAIGLVSIASVRIWRGSARLGETSWVEPLGLYWHFVDVVWVFLLPLLYYVT